jgi:1-acyl-sn-glycerol-3-phosphate acyltransferase
VSRRVANRHSRRAISISTVAVAFASSIVLSPLLFAIAAAVDLITAPRRWRNTRLLAMVVLALAIEVATIVAAGALWLVFGAGRYIRTSRSFWLHHRLQRWYTAALMRAAGATCGLHIDVEDESPASRGNAIVIGRHTSIGDALIPALLFAGRFDINTRYVLKDDLLWGPAFDVVGNRLRNHFVDRAPDDSVGEIAAITRLMDGFDERCVSVIFPEGTFFSSERKARAVKRLADAGRHELAARAEGLRYLLPPRPGGALAMLAGAPHADAVFVGNSGFERFNSLGAIYRSVPFEEPVRVWLWRVPNSEIPKDPEQQLLWLYDQWERLDASVHVRLAAHELSVSR